MLFTKIVYIVNKNVFKIFKDYLENKKPKKKNVLGPMILYYCSMHLLVGVTFYITSTLI